MAELMTFGASPAVELPESVELPPLLPPWVAEVTGVAPEMRSITTAGTLRPVGNEPWRLIAIKVPDATGMTAAALRRATCDLYEHIRTALATSPARYPVRFWNFIPDIHHSLGPELDRYKAFNTGRHDAFRSWFNDPALFGQTLPTATGVGHPGTDLLVYCLAHEKLGDPVENPRQCPAYRYSRRFGPLPPCFARATRIVLGTTPTLLVGGTASVRGEESLHDGCVEKQLEETCINLDSLLRKALGATDAEASDSSETESRHRYRDLRVYYKHSDNADFLHTTVRDRFPSLERLEMVHADICRAELLVEIEGVATLA